MSSLRETVHRNNVRFLVGRDITCIRTGNVLDARTCVVFVDEDDLPAIVLSPEGYLDLVATDPDAISKLADIGKHLDPDTIPKEI